MAKKTQTTTNGKLSISQLRDMINKKAGIEVAFDLLEQNPSEVVEWIPGLSKLVIKYIDDVMYKKNNTISFVDTSDSELAILGRVVEYRLQSLNYFEIENVRIDPLTGHLQSYINNDANDYVITDYEYEIKENNLISDIDKQKKKGRVFKVIKRLFSMCRISYLVLKDKKAFKYAKILTPIIGTNISRLNSISGMLGDILTLLETNKLPLIETFAFP